MINQYTIYGERHSGTNFLQNFIDQSFRLSFTSEYGHKHFFTPFHLESANNKDNTGFFCIVRNPYDWLVAMYKRPHHCAFSYKSLIEFITQQWWSREEFLGPEIYEDRNWNSGERYKNIFELRTNKLKYINELKMYNKYIIQFENFLNLKTTFYVKQNIVAHFRIPSYEHKIIFKPQKNHFLSLNNDTFAYINDNIDWTTEQNFGYYPFNTFDEFYEAYTH